MPTNLIPSVEQFTLLTAQLSQRDAALAERDSEVVQLRDTIAALEHTLTVRTLEIEEIKLQLSVLRRMQFGQKSEKFERQIAQLETRLEDLLADEGEAEVAQPEAKPPRNKAVRRPLPEHLEREVRIHEPVEQACPECGGELKPLGEDIAEQLDIISCAFKVIRHVRRKKACACCDCIVQAPAPSRPIERGIATAGLLAHIAIAKFADHQPLYRQAVINNRQGVDYNRSTMGRGIGLCSVLIRPLVDAAQAYVMQAGKVHADDTTLPVLAPGNGKTRTGRLWAYVRDDRNAGSADAPAVWFAYSPDRQGRHPQEHLRQFKGVLQVDAYAGYHPLFVDGQIREAACMAHARRKIHDLHVRRPTVLTTQALNRIGALYAIEAQIRGQLPEVRKRMRQERSRPLLDDFGLWLREKLLTLSAQSDTAKAINYFINQWDALIYYCDDGLAEIDNNIAENALRAVTLGRKNFLFAGSDSGGMRAASMYSLIGTCKLNGIDPQAYLKHVFTHIGDHPVNRVHELLPWNIPGLRPLP